MSEWGAPISNEGNDEWTRPNNPDVHLGDPVWVWLQGGDGWSAEVGCYVSSYTWHTDDDGIAAILEYRLKADHPYYARLNLERDQELEVLQGNPLFGLF